MKFSSTVWPSKCARYTWSADIDGLGEGGSVGGGGSITGVTYARCYRVSEHPLSRRALSVSPRPLLLARSVSAQLAARCLFRHP